MKNILVVCSNTPEWELFVNTLQWNLSKLGKRYKSTDSYIHNIDGDAKYFYAPNNMYELNQFMYLLGEDFKTDLVVPMCKLEDGVEDYLGLFMEEAG